MELLIQNIAIQLYHKHNFNASRAWRTNQNKLTGIQKHPKVMESMSFLIDCALMNIQVCLSLNTQLCFLHCTCAHAQLSSTPPLIPQNINISALLFIHDHFPSLSQRGKCLSPYSASTKGLHVRLALFLLQGFYPITSLWTVGGYDLY